MSNIQRRTPDFVKLSRSLAKIGTIEKCEGCSCYIDTINEFDAVLKDVGASAPSEARSQIDLLSKKHQATHNCIGCDPCYPVAVSNQLYEISGGKSADIESLAAVGACDVPPVETKGKSLPVAVSIETTAKKEDASCADSLCGCNGAAAADVIATPRISRSFTAAEMAWAVETGDYRLGNPRGSVALATLASEELYKAFTDKLCEDDCAICGKVFTENIGIEKVVKNIVANPSIRFLILCGQEAKGHQTGACIKALHANGLNERGRIVDAPGRRPWVRAALARLASTFRPSPGFRTWPTRAVRDKGGVMKRYKYVSPRITCGVALVLLVCALVAPRSFLAQQGTTMVPRRNERVIINTDLITLNISVTDNYGRAVTGLDKRAFNICDNQMLQEIHFFRDEDAPASISIVFDTSGSMSDDKINQAKEALAHFIQTSHNQDEFFLIDFNSRARLLLDRTRDSDAVLSKLTYAHPEGNTALYDAVYLGLEKVMQASHSRKIVLVISDGEDNKSRYTFKELQRRLRETDVIIYTIGFGGYFPFKGGLNGRETLKELASTTGGKAFFPEGMIEMDEAFERIALEIRHLYSIGYYPSNFAADGKWHRLKIKVTFPAWAQRAVIRNREGYYAGINQ